MNPGASACVLQLDGIEQRFGRLSVLRGVDLTIHAGEVVGLIGANGAGKTTLLSIISGLLQPTAGSRSFWGVETPDVGADVRAKFALVTHTAQVYGRLTARENLELFADLRRGAGLTCAPSVPLLERLGLGHAIDRLAGTFSRGMLQRLALARALLGEPGLLLLDEPFTALDRPGRRLLGEVLLEEQARGAAILLSSHDFDAIAGVTDRVVLLEGGAIAGQTIRASDPEGYRDALQDLAGAMGHAPARAGEVARV